VTNFSFETPRRVRLYVDIEKGRVSIEAIGTTESRVEVEGQTAERVRVTQEGEQINIVGDHERTGFFSGARALEVKVWIPEHSELIVKSRSANINVSGTIDSAQFKSGSGDITACTINGPLLVESGSGDVAIGATADVVRIKSGSGDVRIKRVDGTASISTGSGDISVGTSTGPIIAKSGSGDASVDEAMGDVSLTSASGDMSVREVRRGHITARAASGDFRVGIPAGIPVWTDIHTAAGDIRSNLAGTRVPQPGAEHIEVRAYTATGDITLDQL
jgi:DUF4097 and DUF4098 domain-containing protein YvlB